jgi:hypothetical protein
VRYLIRTVLGFGLMVMCWVIFAFGIYHLLQIGTCASGGPYEIARPCPDGTGQLMMMIPAALLLMFIGGGLYATRGKAPGSENPPRAALVITFFWTGMFWSIALGAFYGVWGPDANAGPDGELGGLIVGFLFVPMGALGLFGLKEAGGKRKGKRHGEMSTGEISVPPAPSFPGFGKASKALRSRLPSEDPVDRLERLSRLRDRGSLSQEEFETLKTKIVREGG